MINALRKICSEVNASDGKLDKFVYSSDASRLEGKAAAVVFPRTVEDVHRIVKFAKRYEKVLVPRGAGTNVVGGCVPNDSVVVDMSKMNKVLEVNPNHVVVQAGVTLDELNKLLKSRLFPIDGNKASTVGGMIARNVVGLRAKEYGRVEDWVLALEIVDGTGKCVQIKDGKVGHFIAMEGTTGIITSATLKLAKRPRPRTLNLLKFNTITSMMEKVEGLLRNPNVTFIEYWDEFVSEILELESKNHLLVEYENEDGEIKKKEEVNHIWELREKLDPKLKTLGFIENECPQMPFEDLDKYIYWLKKRKVPTIAQFAPNFVTSYFKKKELIREEVLKTAEKLKGEINSKYGTGLKYKKYLSQKDKERFNVLKEHYDPKNLMNRGKIQ